MAHYKLTIIIIIMYSCGSSEDKFGADLFSEFLDDIISMANHIEWPSAHLLIMTSYQVLVMYIGIDICGVFVIMFCNGREITCSC